MMAAVEGIHAQMSESSISLTLLMFSVCLYVRQGEDTGDDTEDLDNQSGSEGGSKDERSDDGESDGEVSEDEDRGKNMVEDDSNTNLGWAEAMAKILEKKTAECKSSILVKNKELDKIKEHEQLQQLERKKQVDKKRVLEMVCRVKPDLVKDRETERALQRIATRGVVQLFNAVKKHQKNVDDKVKEVDGSERKKAKILSSVSKKDFITVLRWTEGGSSKAEKNMEHAAATDEKPAWSVLRDDFMIAANMKDWDKDSERDSDPQTVRGEMESDSN